MRQRRRASRELDSLDEKIFALLQADGRRPNTDMARQLGVAEATVRKRIERMVRRQVIQVGAWAADPLKIGYRSYIIIEIQAKPSQIEDVAERLAKLPEICFLGICTGGYDINAAAVFVSNEHMYDFITKGLGEIPGIERTEIASIIRVIKRQYSYPIPSVHLKWNGSGSSPSGTLRMDRDAKSRRKPGRGKQSSGRQ